MRSERRFSRRARVDMPVKAFVDGFEHPCRAVDVSTTGMVVELTRSLASRTAPQLAFLELDLGGGKTVPIRARTVWCKDRMQAVRFVLVNDADKLDIAELLDRAGEKSGMLH